MTDRRFTSARGLRWLARTVWATRIVDRLYGKFNGLRSRLVLGLGSDAFYDAFNDITYAGQPTYRPGSPTFQTELFPWESRIIDAEFPKPPATVIIGGVGGGREALALERRGYRVVAFEPAAPLATALHHSLDGRQTIEVLVGRYQDLPVLRSPNGSAAPVDLRPRAPFDAAILGWASFSHIRSDAGRVEALRQMGALTAGPIFLSYYSYMEDRASLSAPSGSFAMQVGFFRQLTEAEVRALVAEAGLDVVLLKHDDGWPCAVVRRK
ncbi:MAG TPA: hypothetical protein VES67_25110 [Vicinamibacterales bacterium]|nr:hypothetical protein [Vicinamibacterales bacterium]